MDELQTLTNQQLVDNMRGQERLLRKEVVVDKPVVRPSYCRTFGPKAF